MNEACDTLAGAHAPDNRLPNDRAARAALMLGRLTDTHGSRLRCMADALAFLAMDREGLEGIEDLAVALSDHAAALDRGVKDVRAVLDGREWI